VVLNVLRIDGSPTQAYHREHYGADYDYYNFAPIFNRESRKWKPEEWAKDLPAGRGAVRGADQQTS
jgi:alpha-L-fucosidase